MEIPESEDHDSMIFTVSPSTSSSDFTDSASEYSCCSDQELFTANCIGSATATGIISADMEAKKPYAARHVCTETMAIAAAAAGAAGSVVAPNVEACNRFGALCQRGYQGPSFDKHACEKNTTSAGNLHPSDTSFVYSTPQKTFLPQRSDKDENEINEQVRKLQDSFQDIRKSNLIKRKQLFWHALKDYQLAKLNWEEQGSILANCMSLVGTKAEKSSAMLDLAKHLILLNIKTKTAQLLYKVQKNAAKYKRIDEAMVQHFKRCCSGEVCRRLIELWRAETFAEERISWLTWNFKKESYINNGDRFANFVYGIKEPAKYSRSSKQEASFRDKTYGAKGVPLRCPSTDSPLSVSSESIGLESDSGRPIMNYGRGDYKDFPPPL